MIVSKVIGFLLLLLGTPTAALPCSNFFDLTVENFEASGVASFYSSWARNASTTPEFLLIGEVRLFFQAHMGLKELNCGVPWMGCKNIPSCEAIRDRYPEDDGMARRVYFVSKIVDNISLFSGMVYRTTTDAQIDTSNILPSAAETFFWMPDEKNERLCRYLGQATKDAISFSIVMSFAVFPPLLVPAGGAAVIEGSLPWVRLAAGNVMRNPWVANAIQMFPGSYIGPGIDKGCNRFLPVAADQRLERIGQMGRYIRDMLMLFRKDIGSAVAEINQGAGFGENGTIVDGNTVLADLISTGAYFVANTEARDKFINNPYTLEEALSQRITNGVISACLTSSQCYLSCTEDGAQGFCDAGARLAASRFCPRPGMACQAQCWRPSKKAKNVAVYGLKNLESSLWNVRVEDMFSASYDNYAKHSVEETALPNTIEFLNNPVDSSEARASGFRIPVCKCSLSQIGDFSKHGSKNNGLFPCSCGDVYSNETSDFLAAAGFSTNSHKKELLRKCPRQLNKMAPLPVEHFLAFCALGIHWPLKADTRSIKAGADIRCSKVREDVSQRKAAGMSREEMNRWFCLDSAEGIELRKEEHHWVAYPHMRGHDDLCRKFLKGSTKGRISGPQ